MSTAILARAARSSGAMLHPLPAATLFGGRRE